MKVGNICGGVRPGPRVREETWWKRRGGGRRGRWGRETPQAQQAGRAHWRDWGPPGSRRRPFSPLSPRLSARGSMMKHFLPLCHRAPPSFRMEEPLRFFSGDLTGERMQPFPLPMGRGRGPEGSRFPEVPTAHVLAPAIPQVPAWKSGVPGGFRPPGLRLAAAAAGEASGPAGQEPIIARTGERKSSSLPGL